MNLIHLIKNVLMRDNWKIKEKLVHFVAESAAHYIAGH